MSIDLSGVKLPSGGGELPPGTYTFKCQDAEMKETKAGTGKYIKVKLRELSSGRILFHNFNVENPNDKAVEIGKGQLKAFLTGAGYHNPDQLQSIDDLIGLSCEIKTKIRKSEQYGDQAEVSYFKVPKEGEKKEDDNVPF